MLVRRFTSSLHIVASRRRFTSSLHVVASRRRFTSSLHVAASRDGRRSVRPRFGLRLRRDSGAALRGGPRDPLALLLDISGGCAAFYGATPAPWPLAGAGAAPAVALLRGVGPGARRFVRARPRSKVVACALRETGSLLRGVGPGARRFVRARPRSRAVACACAPRARRLLSSSAAGRSGFGDMPIAKGGRIAEQSSGPAVRFRLLLARSTTRGPRPRC
jgi:hypothetical protein